MHFSWTWTEASLEEMDAAEVGTVMVKKFKKKKANPIRIPTGNHLYKQFKQYAPILILRS